MDHSDHVRLLQPGIDSPGGVWADLGSGRGAFTLALADLIGQDGRIFSIDRERRALEAQAQAMQSRFPSIHVEYLQADFRQTLELPPLDGVVMANSLHFQRGQEKVVSQVRRYLKPGGRLLIVEYNIERGNPAVPYPVPFTTWVKLANRQGFSRTWLLATRPSSFLKEIYSACSEL
jgi:ubiquinone/menaquinone biosynthesis C-methylase UbiE